MAQDRVTWSAAAKKDRRIIIEYWHRRNKSDQYGIKLDLAFNQAIEWITQSPEIGRATEKENYRILTLRRYRLLYKIMPTEIRIVRIWSASRNPDKLFGR